MEPSISVLGSFGSVPVLTELTELDKGWHTGWEGADLVPLPRPPPQRSGRSRTPSSLLSPSQRGVDRTRGGAVDRHRRKWVGEAGCHPALEGVRSGAAAAPEGVGLGAAATLEGERVGAVTALDEEPRWDERCGRAGGRGSGRRLRGRGKAEHGGAPEGEQVRCVDGAVGIGEGRTDG